jgi:hypothetical protein
MSRKSRDPTAMERAATKVLAEVKAEDEAKSKANGKTKKSAYSAEPDNDAPPTPRPNGAAPSTNLIPFILKDDGNAERFLAMHGENVRYVDEFNSWMAWDGKRWVKDRIQKAKRLAKETVREFLRQSKQIEDKEVRENCEGYARISHNRALIHSMRDMAQPEALIQPKQLNTNNYLLNCENGTINLETGEMLPHRREDDITKMVNYRYNKDAPREKWLNFLEGITGGGPDVGEGERQKSKRLIDFFTGRAWLLDHRRNQGKSHIHFGESARRRKNHVAIHRSSVVQRVLCRHTTGNAYGQGKLQCRGRSQSRANGRSFRRLQRNRRRPANAHIPSEANLPRAGRHDPGAMAA